GQEGPDVLADKIPPLAEYPARNTEWERALAERDHLHTGDEGAKTTLKNTTKINFYKSSIFRSSSTNYNAEYDE
ncbi:unnamed protein product, partial [Amoebophrya sp. A120]